MIENVKIIGVNQTLEINRTQTPDFVTSDVLRSEVDRAPQYVRDLYYALPDSQIDWFVSTAESNRLAEQYIIEHVVGEKSLNDCKHVALATIAQADVIVAWNLKHMVGRQEEYNRVNEKLGYPRIEIQNPKDFMKKYEENHQ